MDNVHGELAFWTLSQLSHYQNNTFATVYFSCRKRNSRGQFCGQPFTQDVTYFLPEARARMYDPMTSCFLPDPLLNECFFGPEEFHGKLVVCRLEDVLKLVANPTRLRVRGEWKGPTDKRPGMLVFNYYSLFSILKKLCKKCLVLQSPKNYYLRKMVYSWLAERTCKTRQCLKKPHSLVPTPP